MPSPQRWYEPVDAAMIRASTTGVAHARTLPWPDLTGDGGVEDVCRWIAEVWSDPEVVEAVTVASPSLSARIGKLGLGERSRPAQVRRTLLGLARYVLRMRGRSTPFGLFAGVASLKWGTATVRWEPAKQVVRTRAHSVWLALIITMLEADPQLFRRLPVVVNDLACERGDRLVVPWQPHATDPNRPLKHEVTLRLTPALTLVLEHAQAPISVADLADKIGTDLGVPAGDVEELLRGLTGAGVLITALRPASTRGDGLAHLLARLEEAKAADIPGLRSLLTELEEIEGELAQGRLRTGARMAELAPTDHPLAVDLRIGASVTLPEQVAEEAAAAASALIRLSPAPEGDPGWKRYHHEFLSRYGVNAVVPVHQLVDQVAGIGYPSHFTGPVEDFPRELTDRDVRLLRLAQHAALDGAREVVLDEAFINGLHDDVTRLSIPPHLELFTQLWAPTLADVAEGTFRLFVSGIARSGTALSGRFIDLLPEDEQQRRREVYRRLPTCAADAVAAHLSFPPVHPHLENVVRAPRLLPKWVSVAEHHSSADGRFPLADLAVTADSRGMYLILLSSGRVVEPMLANAGARHVMPPMARLLFEMPRARSAVSSPFAWGMARCLPFLPRVVYGRAVLSTARWTLQPAELPEKDLPDRQWRAAFERLRERRGLPDVVSVGDSDLRLRLNLDEPMDLAVLRDHLDEARSAAKPAVIAEGPMPGDHGWFGGRANELVIPVASTKTAAPAPRPSSRPDKLTIIGSDCGVLPGHGHILMAKLYTAPAVFDTILLHHLADLFSQWEAPPLWWFIRYRDPEPHLRLRLHPDDPADAFARVAAWAARLRDHGLISSLVFDTHVPETARYGDGDAQRAVERLFAADSAAVLAQLAASEADRTVQPQALLAAGMVELVTGLTGGVDAGARWLVEYGDPGTREALDRDVVRRAVLLAAPGALADLPCGQAVAAAWTDRARAAEQYRQHLSGTALDRAGTIRSLLHMNHIRATGIDPAAERLCLRTARAVALAQIARGRR